MRYYEHVWMNTVISKSHRDKSSHSYNPPHEVELIEPGRKERGQRAGGEIIVRISKTACGRTFDFVLKGGHLDVLAGHEVKNPDGGGNVTDDWYEALTEVERLDVMRTVAAHYRKPSRDPDGMKTSAIGVVINPDPAAWNSPSKRKRHLIYVGINNHLNTDENSKGCAEQGMVKNASNSITQFMFHKRGEKMDNSPFIKEVYVMGGRDANPLKPGDMGVPAICPCGQCTDLLARWMVPGGAVYVIPHRDQLGAVEVNDRANNFSEVGPRQVWKTTIDNLNRHRVVDYSSRRAEATMQKEGEEALVQRLVAYKPRSLEEVRNSIRRLDALGPDGKPDPVELNAYVNDEIDAILGDRIEEAGVRRDVNSIRQWLHTQGNVKNVRVAVIQLDNGACFPGFDSRTDADKAFINAEFNALGSAAAMLGNNGVKQVWTYSYNPQAVQHEKLVASSKDGLERIYKRPPKKPGIALKVSNIPFNDNNVPAEQLQQVIDANTYDLPDVFPGLFAGNGIAKGGAAAFLKNILNYSPDPAYMGR